MSARLPGGLVDRQTGHRGSPATQRRLILSVTPTLGSGFSLRHAAVIATAAFSAVSAALDRLDPAYRQAAESLGAGSVRVLVRITLPLLLPALGAAAGLAVALSMGELGATVMVYPATWKTLPVTIFGLTDRGQVFQAAASTTLLLAVTLLALMVLGRIRGRAALR